jgi:hypothetical protein
VRLGAGGLLAAAVALAGCAGAGSASSSAVSHRSCPAGDRRFTPGASAGATGRVLVPGAPASVLVCRYWGSADFGPVSHLAGQRLAAGPAVAELARRLDELAAIPTSPAPSCPVFAGRSVLFVFRYRSAADVPVRVFRGGCIPVSNGRVRDRDGEGFDWGLRWPDEGLV